MANKMTVIEKYTAIQAMLSGEYEGEFTLDQAKAFLAERIEQTAKKNASRSAKGEKKLTPTQIANEGVKDSIVAHLTTASQPQAVADLMRYADCCAGKSNQYITQMLTQLRADNRVVRTEVKGRAYYSAPATEDTE